MSSQRLTHACVTPEDCLKYIATEAMYSKGFEDCSTALEMVTPILSTSREHFEATENDTSSNYMHIPSL
jgi:hypothetical protein